MGLFESFVQKQLALGWLLSDLKQANHPQKSHPMETPNTLLVFPPSAFKWFNDIWHPNPRILRVGKYNNSLLNYIYPLCFWSSINCLKTHRSSKVGTIPIPGRIAKLCFSTLIWKRNGIRWFVSALPGVSFTFAFFWLTQWCFKVPKVCKNESKVFMRLSTISVARSTHFTFVQSVDETNKG